MTAGSAVPGYVAGRIREFSPTGCFVLPGSTPVVAFGDPHRSKVATLGLNPSRTEFNERGVELDGKARRFETLRSLDVPALADAPDEIVDRVYRRCVDYFHGNPYRWFNPLEEIVQALGASYFGDTACHLDLSQWATDPTWGRLPDSARTRLVAGDREFLKEQLQAEPVELLLLNGKSVIQAFRSVLGGRLHETSARVRDRSVNSTIYTGTIEGVEVIGWSTNLQSSFGVTREFRTLLAAAVAELAGVKGP